MVEIHTTWGNSLIIEGWALYPELLSEISSKNVKKLWLICGEDVLRERFLKDAEFVKGASNVNLMQEKYLQRSIWHNSKILDECKRLNETYINILCGTTEETVLEEVFRNFR